MNFWTKVASIILKNRIFIILLITIITFFLGFQARHIKFTHTEANLLPEDHPVNNTYDSFVELFGEEGDLILLAVKDSSIFKPEKFNAWNDLFKKLDSSKTVKYSLFAGNIQKLVKDTLQHKFVTTPLFIKKPINDKEVLSIKNELFKNLPFYNQLLYNKKTQTIQACIYIDKSILNSKKRTDFIFNVLNPAIEQFEKEQNLKVHISGMPYIRTMNAVNIIDEIWIFVGLAFIITGIIFFLFFRSFRATFITLVVVSIGVIWAIGFIGLFRYEITILTAMIPPLIIVIGVPNAIFLINKYQQEIKKHGNKAKSLQRVIAKVGNATLMTNFTTASGFATFIFTKSKLLQEFGTIASINILGIFIIAILIIPILFSFMNIPKERHLKHLDKKWMHQIIKYIEYLVRHKKTYIYVSAIILFCLSIIGIYNISISGSMIEDMPKGKPFFKDIVFFEQELGGIMPLEILIDTKKNNGVLELNTLKHLDELNSSIEDIPELSKPISVLNIVKYAKQAFYNGDPKFYNLPTKQESGFILSYVKGSNSISNMLSNFIDPSKRYTRMTTFMKDIGTKKMEQIEQNLQVKIDKLFPKEQYKVTLTGKALLFLKGTNYLIDNLVLSLSLAIVLISLFMAYMFRCLKMILISIIPNIFPLLITAGLMGYLGIPMKPSTILVFSIAFGISVDDTIHFLAKYRQELIANHWNIKKSVYLALRETGISMFYTSVVLFFGFLVFTVSSFGGTKALGGLVSITLLFAMISNLILLPSLLITFEKNIRIKSV